MSRGPAPGARSKADFGATARAAWGAALPDWVEELARYATQTSGRVAAGRIGYSQAVVSHVLRNTYTGDIGRVADKVRGALMGMTVDCPAYGEIGRDRCLDTQKKPRAATSAIASLCWRHCHGVGAPLCPHSRHRAEQSANGASNKDR